MEILLGLSLCLHVPVSYERMVKSHAIPAYPSGHWNSWDVAQASVTHGVSPAKQMALFKASVPHTNRKQQGFAGCVFSSCLTVITRMTNFFQDTVCAISCGDRGRGL